MDYQAFQATLSSPVMWIVSAPLVIISVSQAIMFLGRCRKEAAAIGISKEKVNSAMRSSALTALGPSLSPVIVMLSLIVSIGAPTAWMRLCDVGAARTELGVCSLMASLLGVEMNTETFGAEAFTYSLWGMALNNFGWLGMVFFFTHRMDGITAKMEEKFDSKWIKVMMNSASIGLFAYLLINQIQSLAMTKLTPAVIGAVMQLLITKGFRKNKRLQELSLGISLLCGMLITQALINAGIVA